MSTSDDPIEDWFERRNLTLDLAGLTERERAEGSMYLGGSAAKFVAPGEDFTYSQIGEIAFNWGDPVAEAVFEDMLAHDDRPDAIKNEGFPFAASTRVGNKLWGLAVQRGDFDPAKDYEDASHFIEIPYDAVAGYQRLHDAMEGPFPTPQLIGKVGLAWVQFEGGVTIGEPGFREDEISHAEELDGVIEIDELLSDIEQIIANYDFEHSSDTHNNLFATHIIFWLLETFGQHDDEGQYQLYPNSEHEGFDGQSLPAAIKPLVLHEWRDEAFYSDKNEVIIETDYQFRVIENASLPIDTEGMTMAEITEYFLQHPEEVVGIRPELIGYMPQLKITYRPNSHNGWELEYKVNEVGVTAFSWKKSDTGSSIKNVPAYLKGTLARPSELARSVTELALLATRHTNHVSSGLAPLASLVRLHSRLAGEEQLPLIKGREYEGRDNSRFIEMPLGD